MHAAYIKSLIPCDKKRVSAYFDKLMNKAERRARKGHNNAKIYVGWLYEPEQRSLRIKLCGAGFSVNQSGRHITIKW